jgi:hypothetical protein
VGNGGSLIIIPSEKDTAANLNQFSVILAIQLKSFEQVGETKINFSHPLFKAVLKTDY